MNRREFFIASVGGIWAGYAASKLDTAFQNFVDTNLPPAAIKEAQQVLPTLDDLARELTPAISFEGFNQPGRTISMKPEVFAKALIRMAYLEGDLEEANMVSKRVKTVGLQINLADLEPYKLGVARANFGDPADSFSITGLQISINRNSMGSEDVCWHELFHIIQYARDPYAAKTQPLSTHFITSPLFPAISSILVSEGKLINDLRNSRFTRRNLLNGVMVGGLVGVGELIGIKLGYTTEEDPHHYQLDQRLKLFFTHPFIKQLKGQLWSLEQDSTK